MPQVNRLTKRLGAGAVTFAMACICLGGGTPAGASSSIQGDGDCNTFVNMQDVLATLKYQVGLGAPACLINLNVNCDDVTDARDALLITKHVAQVSGEQPGCTAIGETLPLQRVLVGSRLDFETEGQNGVGSDGGPSHNKDMIVGDDYYQNLGRRAILGFDVSGLQSHVHDATLTLTITESRKDQYPAPGIIDGSPPFTNPGLGDVLVLNISETVFLAQDATAYGSPSTGNDPGVLIPANSEPGATVSIDVTAALQQAIDTGAQYVAFRIQSAVETDGDSLNDTFGFDSGDATDAGLRPKLAYTPG